MSPPHGVDSSTRIGHTRRQADVPRERVAATKISFGRPNHETSWISQLPGRRRGVLGAFATGAAAQDDNVFKLAFVAFLSGPAAELFGKPAVQGAKTVIDALNAGSLPKPYDKIGFGGLKIEVQLIDEAGGATKQVEELRNAFERDHVDAVLGYVSSGDCLAVSPAAEELKKLLVLFDCGTPRIFEENKFKYVFRTAAHGAMDNVAMARYLVKRGIKVADVGAINQDYAWGQDLWKDFKGSLAQLEPEAKAKVELWPKFGAGQYGTEISTLLQEKSGPGLFEPVGRRSAGLRAAGGAARPDEGPRRGA